MKRARATNFDDGVKNDGADSTSFRFIRVQTSNLAGPFFVHKEGFWTVGIYSGDEATANAVAMYVFKHDHEASLLDRANWPNMEIDGSFVATSGIFDSKEEAEAAVKKLEADGIPYQQVFFTNIFT